MKPTDKVRDIFHHDNIEVVGGEIRVYYMRDPQGREWIPYSGGPLYREQAISHAQWLFHHIQKYRECLPKRLRDYGIVYGELSCSEFPGKFRALPAPPEPVEST